MFRILEKEGLKSVESIHTRPVEQAFIAVKSLSRAASL
jgi:hypothetical protein